MSSIRNLIVAGLLLLLTGAAGSQEFGQVNDLFLSPKKGFHIEKVRTLATMQRHVTWVSQPNDSAVVQSLSSNGYQVVGDSLITSEAPDDSLKRYWATGRLRCYVAVKGNDVVICFRGSGGSNGAQTAGNMLTDLRASKTKPEFVGASNPYAKMVDRVEVHTGFHKAYQRLRPRILEALKPHGGKNLYIFGHSLGGAQATLCAFDIGLNQPKAFASRTLIVSGCPRVGDRNFRSLFESVAPGAYRFTVQGDPVARVPSSSNFIHVGDLINVDQKGNVLGAKDLHIDIGEGLERTWRWSHHDYTIYSAAAKALHYEASARDYFNDKGNYPKALADIERGRSR